MRNRAPLLLLCLAGCSRSASSAPASSSIPTIDSSPPVARSAAPSEQASPARALRETTLATSQAYDTVLSLVDAASPRLSGSPGYRAGVEWALHFMKEAGLRNVRAEPVTVPHWTRGAESGWITAPSIHRVVLAALGGSIGTPAEGIEADVIEVASLEALEALDPDAIKGRIVFFDVKTDRTRDGAGYGRAVPARALGPSRASKRGAVGVIIRSIGTDTERAPHTGALHYEDGAARIPAAALSIPDAETLHRIITSGKPVRFKMMLGAEKFPDVETANVVGEVEGSVAPDEIVLLGAHLDSWDLGQGALDDGAGCAIVLEAARQIALLPTKPRRTVRVTLFANEENGLAGAQAYAKAHASELPRHVLALEADLGAARVYETRFLGPESARPQFLAIAKLLAPLEIQTSAEYAEGGADLSPLKPLGVPFMDLRQDATLYFDVHHTANDTVEQIRKEDIDQAAAAYAATAYAAAEVVADFGRTPPEVIAAAKKK